MLERIIVIWFPSWLECVLALWLICVWTWGLSLNFSGSQFPPLLNEDNVYFVIWCENSTRFLHVKCWAQSLGYSLLLASVGDNIWVVSWPINILSLHFFVYLVFSLVFNSCKHPEIYNILLESELLGNVVRSSIPSPHIFQKKWGRLSKRNVRKCYEEK